MPSVATTIAICSDSHYWPQSPAFATSDGAIQLQNESREIIDLLLEDVRSLGATHLLHLGDLTCGGGTYRMPREEFAAALIELRDAFDRMAIPVHVIPGNHDSMPGVGGWRDFQSLYPPTQGSGHLIDTPEARLIMLNTAGHSLKEIVTSPERDPVYGHVSADELARLQDALATASRPVILFLHQLLLPWSGHEGWQPFYGVRNAAEVLEIIARYGNVRAVFQGHAHRYDLRKEQLGGTEIAFFVIPSLIQYPLSWVQLTLTAESAEVHLRCLASDAHQQRSNPTGAQNWRRGRPEWKQVTIPLHPAG